MQAKGTLSLRDQSLDLTLNANANLALLQDFDRDISSSGSVVLATTVRGTFDDPVVNGRMEIHNGTANYTGLPNGIADANGVIVFNGNSATVRNMTAESGGGKVTLSGFASLAATIADSGPGQRFIGASAFGSRRQYRGRRQSEPLGDQRWQSCCLEL